MRRITSRQNPLVARFRAAARGDGGGALLLDGAHLASEALAAGVHVREVVVAADKIDREDVRELVDRFARAGVDVVSATAPVMSAVSPVRSPGAIVALADHPRHDESQLYDGGSPLVVVGVDVQDPGNVGAIVRVAEAAGAGGVIIAGASADPYGWKALRGSMGSALRLPIVVKPEPLPSIDRRRCRVVATVARGGRSVFETDLTGGVAILVGSEGSGLPPAVVDGADERVTIPMQAPVESLNAAVTAAVMLYEARRPRT